MRRPEAPTIWFLLAACTPNDDGVPDVLVVEGDPVPVVSRPLAGGRAASMDNWSRLVASDEDGDRIVVHWLTDEDLESEIRLPAGWAPGAVATFNGGAAVVAQGAGAVVLVRFAPFQIDAVVPVCPDPRGVDYEADEAGYFALVACGDGRLVKAYADGHTEATFVAPDLTHVFYDQGTDTALVATARDGEVLRVDLDTGEIAARYALPTLPSPDGHTLVSRVVRRITDSGDERVMVLHQAHVTDSLDVDLAGGPAYGTGACLSVARPLLTWIAADGTMETVRVDAVLPLDVVAWPMGDGAFPVPTPVVGAVDVGSGPGLESVYPAVAMSDPAEFCVPRNIVSATPGPVVGVAMDIEGPVAVTRDPFSIVRLTSGVVSLREGTSNAGLRLFHAPSPSGVTCASCHALGRDDGHTWDFVGFGPRRTQSLVGGLSATAPYHWDGSLPDLAALFEETGVNRMGHPPVSAADIDALAAWLDQLPVPPRPAADPAAVAAGRVVFDDLGCSDCHGGSAYTDNSSRDVGTGGLFQVPSLIGVSLRLPWMHDGCAATPEERFDPACGGTTHGATDDLDPQALADLITFLGSL